MCEREGGREQAFLLTLNLLTIGGEKKEKGKEVPPSRSCMEVGSAHT